MNLPQLEKYNRLFWATDSVAESLGISAKSASVLCSRYAKKGIFVKLRNNMYLASSKIPHLTRGEIFYLGNLIQTPSYISFMTALSYYGVTTQITRDVIESASLVRTKEYDSGSLFFGYMKIKKDLFFGFERIGSYFIASKEKAFLDCLYLQSLGRYNPDMDSIDFSKLSKSLLKKLAEKFPEKTNRLLKKFIK